jgi:aryl-alcohol dehydrogenase-like predicted oxidoreductase
MHYVKLGNTGLDVSRICLGCMSFGIGERGQFPWALNVENSRPMIKKALDVGINFFDTANLYSVGTSEEITGRALAEFADRDEIVLATKVFFRTREGANGAGLSRKAIMSEIAEHYGDLIGQNGRTAPIFSRMGTRGRADELSASAA